MAIRPRRGAFVRGPYQRSSAKPLADLVSGSIADACGKAGFTVVEVVTHWDEIVGPELAPRTMPLKLQWQRRPEGAGESEAATLIVRVEGAYAIELQYAAPVVIERINTYFGWRCVGKLALRQGPVPPRHEKPAAPSAPDAKEIAEARSRLGAFEDEDLAAALSRLGAMVRRARTKAR